MKQRDQNHLPEWRRSGVAGVEMTSILDCIAPNTLEPGRLDVRVSQVSKTQGRTVGSRKWKKDENDGMMECIEVGNDLPRGTGECLMRLAQAMYDEVVRREREGGRRVATEKYDSLRTMLAW